MDLMRCDQNTYKPSFLIHGYKSLIWTERYQEPGSFELTTGLVEKTMTELPLGSFVAIRESEELAMVESYEIEEDEEGESVLTVTGRTIDFFLENRMSVDNSPFYNKIDPNTGLATNDVNGWFISWASGNESNVANYIIQKTLISSIQSNKDEYQAVTDHIPGLLSSNVSTSGNNRYYVKYLERGNAHEAVMKLIKASGDGLRVVRPTATYNPLVLFIYTGINRTKEQSANERIILKHSAGHIQNVKYLRSIKDYKNTVFVYPKTARRNSNDPWSMDPRPGISGWNKRTILADAPEVTPTSALDVQPSIDSRIRAEMAAHAPKNLITFTLSPNLPYKFGTHYRVGDIITVQGNYGISQNMRISEYIRVQDTKGERAYPTLELL